MTLFSADENDILRKFKRMVITSTLAAIRAIEDKQPAAVFRIFVALDREHDHWLGESRIEPIEITTGTPFSSGKPMGRVIIDNRSMAKARAEIVQWGMEKINEAFRHHCHTNLRTYLDNRGKR